LAPITPPLIPPVTNAQTIGKFLAAILAGGPIGWIAGVLISSWFENQHLPDVALFALVVLVIMVIANVVGDRLEKMHTHTARWWLLIAVGAVPIGILNAYTMVMMSQPCCD